MSFWQKLADLFEKNTPANHRITQNGKFTYKQGRRTVFAPATPMKYGVPQVTVDLIHSFEKLHKVKVDGRVYAYHDPVGYPTQGWGHLLSKNKYADLSQYPSWSKERANEVFSASDLPKFVKGVDRLVKVPLHPLSKGALVSFSFNVGLGNFQASTLLRKVNAGDFADVPRQFARWKYSDGQVLNGLIRRRTAEAAMFMDGVAQK